MKRLNLLLLCCILALSCAAQSKKKQKKFNNKKANESAEFLDKQWWLGFKAGTNLSNPVVVKRYAVFSPILSDEYEGGEENKKYESFRQFGSQAALEITFTYKRFSISVQPTYRSTRFVYSNQYEWAGDTIATNHLILKYEQEQKVEHAVIPLIVKYEITGNKIRPYAQFGIYTAFLINANKTVRVSGTDNASGGANNFHDPDIIVGAKDLFAKKNWGIMGGVGLNYHLGNVRFNFDVLYAQGMSSITSAKNRFGNDRVAGIGDAMDDMKLNNLAISLGCLFPLRFLGSGFKSIDK